MFTFSFGSAFAANLTDDEISELKAYAAAEAAKYLDGDFEQAAASYVKGLTFDKNDKLIAATDSSYSIDGLTGAVSKALIEETANGLITDAETQFRNAVAGIQNNISTDADTKNTIIVSVKTAYDTAVADNFNDTKVLGATGSELLSLLKKQLKADQDTAATELSKYVSTDYSNDVNEWSIVVKDALVVTDAPSSAYTDTTTAYNMTVFTGKAAGTQLTAKQYVEAIVGVASAKINAAGTAATSNADYANAINDANLALATATDLLAGHKRTTGENYYIEAVPTSSEIKADTSVAEAKTTAITQMKAALAYKQIELQNELQALINELNQNATLSTSQKTALENYTKAKAALANQFAAAEEVFTARINYCETTAAVKALLGDTATAGTILGKINAYDTAQTTGLAAATKTELDRYVALVGYVDDIEAEAALRNAQKDVNGQPYYDAEVLASNLADAIKYLYTDENGTATYSGALDKLDTGMNAALIRAKIDYIDFITGEAARVTPLDSQGKKVTSAWNKASAAGTVNGTVAVMANGKVAEPNYAVSETSLYDKAQKAELKALVAETTEKIEAAATIAEVKAIFAEANDKYVAIPTTTDHFNAWASTGKIGLAYSKADYDTDLLAYAKYFINRIDVADYPSDVNSAKKILSNVAYPIVYGAYTAEELPEKIVEAKAAIDAIKSTANVTAERKAVEALINALPSTITLADKDAITAAADAFYDYIEIPGATNPVNITVLDNAIAAYEKLAAKELDDAYKALDAKTITTDDEAAVEALREQYDAYDDFCSDYFDEKLADSTAQNRTATTNDDDSTEAGYPTSVQKLEKELSNAKIAAVRAMMINLPANPTAKDRAAVEAARTAYEALSLEEKGALVDGLPYKNMIDAEESLEVLNKYAVEALKITASSTAKKGSITVKWTVKGDAAAADGYQIYRSLKKNSGFGTKPIFTTTKQTYKNTKALKKGTRYYYKVRAYVEIDGVKYYSDWSNKAYRIAK